MSVKVMARVWAHSQRKDGELLVMLALADFSNDAGESWPSIPILAQKARLSERQTRKVLAKLEEAGEIRRTKSTGGRNRRNHYFINLSENPEIKTLNKEQGKNNPVLGDIKTLSPVTGALNHHRTVNKDTGAKAPDSSSSISERRKQAAPAAEPEAFTRWYEVYPRHEARVDAEKAWWKLDPAPALIEKVMSATARYAAAKAGTKKQFIKLPASWLNGKRWEDDIEDKGAGNGNGHEPPKFRDLGNGIVEADGLKMSLKDYERKYGARAS
jgi:hypothetical protein